MSTGSDPQTDFRVPSLGSGRPDYGAGTYLTNEAFLYRVVNTLDETVELEDCYRLDSVRISVRALRERRLRVVVPARPTG